MRLGDMITTCDDVLQIWEVSFEGCPCITLDCSVIATEDQFADVLTEDFRNRQILSINSGKKCTNVLVKG